MEFKKRRIAMAVVLFCLIYFAGYYAHYKTYVEGHVYREYVLHDQYLRLYRYDSYSDYLMDSKSTVRLLRLPRVYQNLFERQSFSRRYTKRGV